MESLTKQYRVQSKSLSGNAAKDEVIQHTLVEHDPTVDAAAPGAMAPMRGGPGAASGQITFQTPVHDTFPDGAIVEVTLHVVG